MSKKRANILIEREDLYSRIDIASAHGCTIANDK